MDNHWVVNYPDLSQAQHDKLAGQIHISIGGENLKASDSYKMNPPTNALLLHA